MRWTGIGARLFALALRGRTMRARVCVCVCLCTLVRILSAACGQSVAAAVGGTAGRLITESEETSHPPPLFLPGPKVEQGLLQHTHTHTHTSLEFKSILPHHHSAVPILFNDLFFFFLLVSDRIELVEPLVQGLPKRVGEF